MSNYQSYTAYQAPEETPSEYTKGEARVTVLDGAQSLTMTDGTMTSRTMGTERGSTAGLNPHHGTDHFGATAQNPDGTPVTGLLPSTLVTIGGVQAPCSFFVNQGILQQAPDGTFTEAEGTPEVAPEADTSGFQPLPDATMASVNAALDTIEQHNLDGLIASGMGAALGRLDDAAFAQKFGQVSGLDPQESAARVAVLKSAYQGQADTALTTRGGLHADDLQGFYAWARANKEGDLRGALDSQLRQHDVSGWTALAKVYMDATPPSLNALKAAGIKTRINGTSRDHEAFIRGQWMSPGAAARAGLI